MWPILFKTITNLFIFTTTTTVSNNILKLSFSVSFIFTQQDTHEEIDDDNYAVNITKEMTSTMNMILNTSSM